MLVDFRELGEDLALGKVPDFSTLCKVMSGKKQAARRWETSAALPLSPKFAA
jgi:hypothetical protein